MRVACLLSLMSLLMHASEEQSLPPSRATTPAAAPAPDVASMDPMSRAAENNVALSYYGAGILAALALAFLAMHVLYVSNVRPAYLDKKSSSRPAAAATHTRQPIPVHKTRTHPSLKQASSQPTAAPPAREVSGHHRQRSKTPPLTHASSQHHLPH